MPQRIMFVPAILVILLAAVLSSARTSLAAESCASKPSSTAPQGEHWYYRLDRTLHRPCWYLGPEGAHVSQAGTPRIHSALRLGRPRPTALASTEPSAEAMNAYAARTRISTNGNGITPGENRADPNFTTRWPDRPDLSDASVHELASLSNDDAARPASVEAPDGLSLKERVSAHSDRAVAGMSDETQIGFVRMLALIGGALAFSVLIIRSAFSQPAARLIARSKSRDQRRSSANAFRSPLGAVAPRASGATRRSAGAIRRNGITPARASG